MPIRNRDSMKTDLTLQRSVASGRREATGAWRRAAIPVCKISFFAACDGDRKPPLREGNKTRIV